MVSRFVVAYFVRQFFMRLFADAFSCIEMLRACEA